MSEVKVNKISPRSGTDVALGDSGDTFTIPAGATLANNGTATGFFEGIAWQSVVTAATLTTVAGKGYPINTTSNACTVTLPAAASVGDQVQIVDYAGTFATNNITLTSSLNINGAANNKLLTTNREGVIITYVDVTQGWVATSGVNSGDQALDPNSYAVDFLVIAGGGAGGHDQGGGAGAGGYRNSFNSETSGGGGSSEASLTFNGGTVYTVTVGAGGAGVSSGASNSGVDSSISGTGITTITSIAGGRGGQYNVSPSNAASGGSGGGGAGSNPDSSLAGGSGTSNQGYAGGTGNLTAAAGGGGAGAVGGNAASYTAGNGGNGVASEITGSSVTRAGGGGGNATSNPAGLGGTGGGGDATNSGSASAESGEANTGSGGGGSWNAGSPYTTGSGGSGVVILRMLDADYSGTTTGSPTVATGVGGTDTVLTFTGSGSYTG
jgi:hypothetical protein